MLVTISFEFVTGELDPIQLLSFNFFSKLVRILVYSFDSLVARKNQIIQKTTPTPIFMLFVEIVVS